MDAIRHQYSQLQQAWDAAYAGLAPNPSAYQPHLAGASLEQLNEAVKVIGVWLDRARAPKGFAPTFHLSKSLAATALAAASTAAQALSRGEYGHLPPFITAVNQTISALHTVLIFSEKSLAREATAELAGKLAEAIALTDTAQRELAKKTEALSNASKELADAETIAESILALRATVEQSETEVRKYSTDAAALLTETKEAASDIEDLKQEVEDLLGKATTAGDSAMARQDELGVIIDRAREQEELISALLPKGASAGLASAFAGRVQQLERSKWLWMGVFILAMIGLFGMAWRMLDLLPPGHQALWEVLLQRIPFAAPVIWLGWFAAVQYGNTLRVQEDYAFKEATSKAFAGYRDHMEHLANVALDEGNTAMTLMAQRTIEILAHEPLRIFRGIEDDTAPTQGLLDRLRHDKRRAPKGASD